MMQTPANEENTGWGRGEVKQKISMVEDVEWMLNGGGPHIIWYERLRHACYSPLLDNSYKGALAFQAIKQRKSPASTQRIQLWRAYRRNLRLGPEAQDF